MSSVRKFVAMLKIIRALELSAVQFTSEQEQLIMALKSCSERDKAYSWNRVGVYTGGEKR